MVGRDALVLVGVAMIPLHVSEMIVLQQCGRRWQHAYADRRVPLVPHERLTRGTRMHRWLAAWWSGDESIAPCPDGPETPIEFAMAIGYARTYAKPHLTGVRVNVPFTCELGGVPVAGTADAVGFDPDSGQIVVVEHKTHRGSIAPGSQYWRERIACDPQVSMYQAAFPGSVVLYDVLRVPQHQQLQPNSRRKEPESDEAFIERLLQAIAEEPASYYQRQILVRLDEDRRAFEEDVRLVSLSRSVPQPRNTRACFDWGECEYFDVCFHGADIQGPQFTDRED